MTLETLVLALGNLGFVWPDRVSALCALTSPWTPPQRRSWGQLVEAAYSREALRAGHALFGRNLLLQDLAHIAANAQAWLHRSQEAAGLAPLLSGLVRVRANPPANLGTLRAGALSRGLTPAAWKWLRRQRNSLTSQLFSLGFTPEAVWWANLLARALPTARLDPRWFEEGRPYMGQPLYEYVRSGAPAGYRQSPELEIERLYRLLPPDANAERLAHYEMLLTGLLVGWRRPEFLLSVRPGNTWNSLLDKLRRNNDRRLNQATSPAKSELVSWPAILGEQDLRGIKVRELCSTIDLEREGALMVHCVGDGGYTEGCARGAQVVMSLEEPRTRARATLQLRRKLNGWSIGQLAGPANTRVAQVFWQVARDLASRPA